MMFLMQSMFVFSTYVEVILSIFYGAKRRRGILHVCGGDPEQHDIETKEDWYSPRMWR